MLYYSLVIELNYSQISFDKYNKYSEEKSVTVRFQQILGKDRLTQITTRSHVDPSFNIHCINISKDGAEATTTYLIFL